MEIYIFSALLLLPLVLFSYKKKISVGIILFAFTPLLLLSVLRYDIGCDYSGYLIIFEHPEIMSVKEKGFMLINAFVKKAGLPFQLVVIIFSLVTLLLIVITIAENSNDILLSIFLFYSYPPFFLDTTNAIRQWFAIGFFLFATRYIKERKPVRYSICIIFAAYFAHTSAIVLLPLYFLLNRDFTYKFKILFLVISFFFAQAIPVIIAASPYAIYSMGNESDGALSPVLILDFLLTVAVVILGGKNKKNLIFYNLCLISLGMMIMGISLRKLPVFVLIFRINEYFLPALCICIPDLIISMKEKRNIYRLGCLFAFLMLFYLSVSLNGVRNEICPYQTFFGKFNSDFITDLSIVIIATFFSLLILMFAFVKNNIKRHLKYSSVV